MRRRGLAHPRRDLHGLVGRRGAATGQQFALRAGASVWTTDVERGIALAKRFRDSTCQVNWHNSIVYGLPSSGKGISGSPGNLIVNARLRIPLAEFVFRFARSSGPGGQNVNKVNSKAQLRWPVLTSASLPEAVRQRLRERFGNRITADGDLLIVSQRYRDQARNVDDCLGKLRLMLDAAWQPPMRRKRTKPSRASIERRLGSKRRLAEKKQNRRGVE